MSSPRIERNKAQQLHLSHGNMPSVDSEHLSANEAVNIVHQQKLISLLVTNTLTKAFSGQMINGRSLGFNLAFYAYSRIVQLSAVDAFKCLARKINFLHLKKALRVTFNENIHRKIFSDMSAPCFFCKEDGIH